MVSSPTGNIGLPGGVSIPLPFVQATAEASVQATLSTSKTTTTTTTKGTTISETISPTIPPHKKLYIVAIQKVQKGAISYKIPVSITGSVVTKQAASYTNRPASFLKKGGFERPVDVKFSPNGKTLYVVDFGVIKILGGKTTSHEGTGMIWKITKQ